MPEIEFDDAMDEMRRLVSDYVGAWADDQRGVVDVKTLAALCDVVHPWYLVNGFLMNKPEGFQ